MATVTKDFRVKAGLVVEGSTATVNGHDILTEALVDAKGDILIASAADAVARLGVGTNGQVLTAASGATYGVEWAAPAAVGVFGTEITFEGATANDFETTVTVTDPTADRTITFPDATGTVALTSDVSTHADLTEAHGATGAVVGTTNTQTLTNKTLTSPKINEDVVLTATATELNTLDGITSSTAELNLLDGVTATTTELNYVDGVTSAIQTQLDGKLGLADAAVDYYVTNSTNSAYIVNGVTNGAIYFEKGKKYRIHVNATGHPFWIQTTSGAYNAGNVYSTGITNNGTANGHILVELPQDAPQLYYVCQLHSVMGGLVNIGSAASTLTLSGSIILEGATADAFETTLAVTDPTADRTITFPDATGTAALTNNKLDVFAATTSAELRTVISDETGTGALVFADTPTLVTPNIGAATGTSLVLSGDLTVNGTTTTINSTEITIDDKNLVLGAVTSPTDAGADGGGLTLKGATDKTFNWVDATDSWTSSEHLDLASGKVLKVAGTQVLSATEYTGNAATVTNGVYTTSKISALAATTSAELAGVISDETGTDALVFANTPTLVTPVLGAATATSITLADAFLGSALATAGTSATTIDTWSATTYSAAKYIVQMKNAGGDIEVIEVLVAIDGSNNVYLTEYADVQSNGELGTTNAVYSSGNVLLQVTAASANTVVKVSKTYIEA